MGILELTTILGRVYAADVLHRGSIDAVKDDFILAMDDPGFKSAARTKLDELTQLEKKVGPSRLHERDIIGFTYLKFLRAMVLG